jgi:hypothetical protein
MGSPARRAGEKRQFFTVSHATASSVLDPLERSSSTNAFPAQAHAQR